MAKNLLIGDKSSINKKSKRAGLHDEHRKRVKENFRKGGLDGFQPHNVLEMLLFYSIPRRDTNEIAHMLIEKFGSLAGVFDAPIEALTNVEGIGLESATLIKFIPEIFKEYEASKYSNKTAILSSEDAKKFLSSYYKAATYEKFVILYLDAKGRILKDVEISQGNETMVSTDFSALLKSALLLNAKGIVISHNHIDGFAVPSTEDKILTEKLASMCKPLGIHLCDHILFSGNDIYYFSKSQYAKSCRFTF